MNNKKIIFLAIFWVLVFIILFVSLLLSWWNNDNNTKVSAKNFKIWILNDDLDSFKKFVEVFKNDTGNTSFSPEVESFSNYEEYNNALSSAIIRWEAPDIYMLNNNEKSIYLENIVWLKPEDISPDELRTYFKPFFWDDLIYSRWEWDEKVEFLAWVPFWYETLWLYFDLRRVWDVKKITSFPKIQNFIEEFNESKPWMVALWIWRWETVEYSQDIIAQFLMSERLKSIWNSSQWVKWALSEYYTFASWNNNYVTLDSNLKKEWKTNIDAFADWDLAMLFWYPRTLFDIDKKWFSKRLLRVVNFPSFINESDIFVNYNYFVINGSSKNIAMANEFMKYIFSEKWQTAYLKEYTHYMPARVSVYSEYKDREILDWYSVKLKNFDNPEVLYSSFDKWIKSSFDREIPKILDDEVNYLTRVSKYFSSLKCKTDKILNLTNLSSPCD